MYNDTLVMQAGLLVSRTVYITSRPQALIKTLYSPLHTVIVPSQWAAQSLSLQAATLAQVVDEQLQHYGLHRLSLWQREQLWLQGVRHYRPVIEQPQVWLDWVRSTMLECLALEHTQWLQQTGFPLEIIVTLLQGYQSQLRAMNAYDAEERYVLASQLALSSQPYVLYAVSLHHTAMAQVVNQLCAENSVMICTPDDASLLDLAQWQQWGWQVQTETLGHQQDVTLPDAARLYQYPTVEAEITATLQSIQTLLGQGVPVSSCAVVLPINTTYEAILKSQAERAQCPLLWVEPVPFTKTRFGAWCSVVLNTIRTGYQPEDLWHVVTHSYGPPIEPETYRELLQRRPPSMPHWPRYGVDTSLLQPSQKMTWLQFTAWWQTLMTQWSVALNVQANAQDAAAWSVLKEQFAHLSVEYEREDDADAELSLEACIQRLLFALKHAVLYPDGHAQAVHVHRVNTIAGCYYQAVWLLGAAEGYYPQSLALPRLLSWEQRETLNASGDRSSGRSLLSFEQAFLSQQARAKNVLRSSQQLVASYARLVGMQPAWPSPLLSHYTVVDVPAVNNLDTKEVRTLPTYQAEQCRLAQPNQTVWDGVLGVNWPGKPSELSVTELNTLGQCGFKWLARHHFKLRQLDYPTADAPPSDVGRFLHRVLEELLKPVLHQPLNVEQLLAELPQVFTRVEQTDSIRYYPQWLLQRQEWLQTLQRVFAMEGSFPADVTPIALEQPFEVRVGDKIIRGRIDRIDRGEQGLIAIDYKTGTQKPAGIQSIEGRLNQDLQVSFYLLEALSQLYPDEVSDKGVYWSIKTGKALQKIESRSHDAFEEALQRLMVQLDSGQLTVKPDVEQAACQQCDLEWVCRKGPRLLNLPGGDHVTYS